jgi:sodium/proline symporter
MKLVETLFHPVIAGICLAGILAAVMSTADSQLLVASSAVAEDFYKALLRPDASQKELVWLGRAAVVVVALVALIIASDKQSSVLGLVGYAWAGFGAAFGPTMLVSLLWQRMNRAAALVGMLVGGSVVVLWRHLAGLVTQIAGALEAIGLVHTPGQSTITLPAPFGIPIFELYALVPGFILSLGSILIVTALTTAAPPRNPSAQ